MVTREIINASFESLMPPSQQVAEVAVHPNMPWAEEEFQERVSGEPHNPHHSMEHWPWWRGQIDPQMSHTYSERFWPTFDESQIRMGIRYAYGDLQDVVDLLRIHPHTRQATFPIFFPEDTGAIHGGRIPCTLHYHFMLRQHLLNLWYPIRSCDAVRHFRDDVYMAIRLCQWVIGQLNTGDDELWSQVSPGWLFFTAYSFHVHAADEHLL
jgi:thymidylate synthase